MPEPAPEVSVGWNILTEPRGVSALLEILQEDEPMELLLSLMVPWSLGCLPENLEVFGVVLSGSSSGISCVADQRSPHGAAGWCRTTCCVFLCLAVSWAPVLGQKKKKQQETVFFHLLVRLSKL